MLLLASAPVTAVPGAPEAAVPDEVPTLAWDPGREAIAGIVGGLPITITGDSILAFAAGEGITPTEAATLIVAAELQRFVVA